MQKAYNAIDKQFESRRNLEPLRYAVVEPVASKVFKFSNAVFLKYLDLRTLYILIVLSYYSNLGKKSRGLCFTNLFAN